MLHKRIVLYSHGSGWLLKLVIVCALPGLSSWYIHVLIRTYTKQNHWTEAVRNRINLFHSSLALWINIYIYFDLDVFKTWHCGKYFPSKFYPQKQTAKFVCQMNVSRNLIVYVFFFTMTMQLVYSTGSTLLKKLVRTSNFRKENTWTRLKLSKKKSI